MGAPVKASRELARAVEDEAHRAQVDAAKKRAVGQLSDYDTFRNMVSVAHLRPLQAESRADRAAGAAAWNFDGAGQAVAEPGPGSAAGCAAACEAGGPSEPPRSRDEFLAAWRRARGGAGCSPGGQRWALLQLCGAERVGSLFRVEVEGKLLAEVVAAAAAALEVAGRGRGAGGAGGAGPADHLLAAELLLALAGSARFGLAKALAGRACAGQAAEVLARARDALAGAGGDEGLVQRAAVAFGVALPPAHSDSGPG